jgi:archaemetzincin
MTERIDLVPIGAVPPGLLDAVAACLSDTMSMRCTLSDSCIDPANSHDPARGQYDSHLLLPPLEQLAQTNGTRVLGVTEVDIFSSVFTFVFGVAKLRGVAAVISLHRLRTSFYGLPEDAEVLVSRAQREAVHEIGHLLGSVHCRDRNCVMSFSAAAEEIDLKSDHFCALCKARQKDGVLKP